MATEYYFRQLIIAATISMKNLSKIKLYHCRAGYVRGTG